MDTVYYTLNTRKVKAAGGAELLTFVPTPAAAPAGEVLDFDRCRRKLETKAAWKDLARTAEACSLPPRASEEEDWEDARYEIAGLDECYEALPRPRRESRVSAWLELGASAAVILVSLTAVLAFCGLV